MVSLWFLLRRASGWGSSTLASIDPTLHLAVTALWITAFLSVFGYRLWIEFLNFSPVLQNLPAGTPPTEI